LKTEKGKRNKKPRNDQRKMKQKWEKKTSYIVFEGKMALSKIVSPLSYILLKF